MELTEKEHKQRHKELHSSFDELIADYGRHTEKLLAEISVMDLIHWSYVQTLNPTLPKGECYAKE